MLRRAMEQRFHVSQEPPGWVVKGYGLTSHSGEDVTPDNALKVSAVYACISILAETIASLPCILYQRKGNGRVRAVDNPKYTLLHDKPNREHSPFVFKELLQCHQGSWGNGYAQILRLNSGEIGELFPLRPDRMARVYREGGKKKFVYRSNGSEEVVYNQDEILHLQGFGSNGLTGLSPIDLARNAIGLAMSAEKYGSKVFQNDARPSVVIKHPKQLSEKGHKNLKQSWVDTFGGADNAGKPAILEEGMDLETVGFPPEQSEFLETQKFEIAQISRWFKVPLSLLGEHDKASTYASVEQFLLSFEVHTIRPICVRWEQALNLQLLTENERKAGFYFEFLLDALLRGDTAARFTSYREGFNIGAFTINDILSKENMDPMEGEQGGWHWVPLNMTPVQDYAQEPAVAGATRNQRSVERFHGNAKSDGEVERRERRQQTARARRRLARAQRPVLAEAAERILRREKNDIREGIRKNRKYPLGDTHTWLDGFYRDHRTFSAEKIMPALQSYARMVTDLVDDELGKQDERELTPEIERFLRAYASAFAVRNANRSQAWLEQWLTDHWDEDDETFFAGLDEYFDVQLSSRPGRIAREESVRSGNALARELYILAGVVYLVSVSTGESCPYCDALDGRVIGVHEIYLQAGEEFNPEGADAPLKVNENMGHSPYHDGCDCVNVAEY